ncbi:hypothetical protein D3C72_2096120 [compost metagenome]
MQDVADEREEDGVDLLPPIVMAHHEEGCGIHAVVLRGHPAGAGWVALVGHQDAVDPSEVAAALQALHHIPALAAVLAVGQDLLHQGDAHGLRPC